MNEIYFYSASFRPYIRRKKCRKSGNNPLLSSKDPKGSFRCSHHSTVLTPPSFDNPVGLHWSQAGCVPSHMCTMIVTEGVHREIIPGIQYSFWVFFFCLTHFQAGVRTPNQGLCCNGQRLRPLGHCTHFCNDFSLQKKRQTIEKSQKIMSLTF